MLTKCPFCAIHGDRPEDCSVLQQLNAPRNDYFATWRECAEYERAAAIHAHREVLDLRIKLQSSETEWINRLGSESLLAKIERLEQHNQKLATDKGILASKLYAADRRLADVRRVAIRDVILELQSYLETKKDP